MSTLSAQCDELRAMAESVGLEMPQSATLMMDAADTIDRLDAENAKLREENQSIGLAAYELGRRSMAGENAKLRELVLDMWCCISHIGEYDVFYYDMAKDGCGISCTVNGEHCCADKLHDRMRELGVEVQP